MIKQTDAVGCDWLARTVAALSECDTDLMLSTKCSMSILMSTKMYIQGTLVKSTGTRQLCP